MKPTILHENSFAIGLNKPAGMLVHKTPGSSEATLVDWLLEHYPEIATIGDDHVVRPGIVHRLDRETSGAMIVARTQEAFDHFKRQFQERRVKKIYQALVVGTPSHEQGIIDLPIAQVGIKRVVAKPGRTKAKNEKEALTHWKIQQRFRDFTLLTIEPKTGRTNQIRVHLTAMNHPIACDPVYGGKAVRCPENLNRLFLHAQLLELTNPDGSLIHLEASLPNDLTHTLQELEKE